MKNQKIYQSREFRDNLSEAFQNAIEGKTVIIKRFNRKFILVPEVQYKKQREQFESIEKRIKILEDKVNE